MATHTSGPKRPNALISKDRDDLYKSQSKDLSLTPPETPPNNEFNSILIQKLPDTQSVTGEDGSRKAKRRKLSINDTLNTDDGEEFDVPHQEVLLLHGIKQKYIHTIEQPIPVLKNEREMLVEVQVIGLNPIDWKAPDFGWGLPVLPCISGRDFAGRIVKTPTSPSRFKRGDYVMAVSTDYRDSRKSAYQQYAVVSDFSACKLPVHISAEKAAPLGVAFVAAGIALGVCLGLNFWGSRVQGPNLLQIVRSISREDLPRDIRAECFDKMQESEVAKRGDWIAIWGGSSASGCCAVQLAKLAGLKVIAVVDMARNGERMLKYGADLLVDRLDPNRAIEIIKAVTKNNLRFGLDTRGKESTALLAQAMQPDSENVKVRSHLVGLTGLPKERRDNIVYHSVPIKVFHEAPQIGEGLMVWLEKLLESNALSTLDIEVVDGGLKSINEALDKLRSGAVNGPRIVVPLCT